MREYLRRCIFRPYRKGCGPAFTLTLWEWRYGGPGGVLIEYTLQQSDLRHRKGTREEALHTLRTGETLPPGTLFHGRDFGPGRFNCVDSDEAIEGLMGFLTLRPGDTDAEYFRDYTAAQLEFCSQHAEVLSGEVCVRFNGRGD